MKTPFVFGQIASDNDFTDRVAETRRLVDNFKSSVNTIIISPRRWGKTSLVHKAAEVAGRADQNIRIVFMDLFNIRDEEHFFSMYAEAVLKATSSKWEEIVETAKRLLSSLVPKVTIGAMPDSEISVDFDWDKTKLNQKEILDLPEKVAAEKGYKVVVCIDEFQNIALLPDGEFLQRAMRSHWQLHKKVAYCLYGSKRHMMLEIFNSYSKPFYKFGDLIMLGKIPVEDMVDFIVCRFSETGKSISTEDALLIDELVDNHPYYTQQLAQLSWLRTTGTCDRQIVMDAFSSLVDQLSLLFVNITESLTDQQLNYLRALLAGEQSVSQAEVMHRYKISSATAALRSREALIKKDILDKIGKEVFFLDPVYQSWLRDTYFGLS